MGGKTSYIRIKNIYIKGHKGNRTILQKNQGMDFIFSAINKTTNNPNEKVDLSNNSGKKPNTATMKNHSL